MLASCSAPLGVCGSYYSHLTKSYNALYQQDENEVLSCFLYTKLLDFSYPFFLDEKRTKKIKTKLCFHPLCQFARITAKDGKPLLRNSKQIGIHPDAGSQFCHSPPLMPLRGKWPNREQ